MPDVKNDDIVIKRQNFDKALLSINTFTNNAKENKPLEKVPAKKSFMLWKKDYKVKGNDLNTVVSVVNINQIEINKIKIHITDFAIHLCEALNCLDNEYLLGIEGAAKLAKSASDKANKNVEAIEKIIKVLQKFKESLDMLEHLMDVDKAWGILEEHKNTLKSLCDYKDKLSSLKHLTDVDDMWKKGNFQAETLKIFEEKLENIHKLLDEHNSFISGFIEKLDTVMKSQQVFVEESNKRISERQALIEQNLKENKSEIQKEFDSLNKIFNKNQEMLDKKFATLSDAQKEALYSMRKAQNDALSHIENFQAEAVESLSKSQTTTLNNIEKTQNEKLEEISKEHMEILSKLVKEQNEKFDSINTTIQLEKEALREQASVLTKKMKIAYIIAGSSAAITIMHIILNVLGVI